MADDGALHRIKVDADGRRVNLPALLKGLADAGYNDVLVKLGRDGVSIRAHRQPLVSLPGGELEPDAIDRVFGDGDDD